MAGIRPERTFGQKFKTSDLSWKADLNIQKEFDTYSATWEQVQRSQHFGE